MMLIWMRILCKGRRVPILLWAISPDCEEALDAYEGWPTLYRKETLPVKGITWMLNDITAMPAGVTEVSAMICIMSRGHPAPPSVGYMEIIERGYWAMGSHLRYMAEGVRRTAKRKVNVQKRK